MLKQMRCVHRPSRPVFTRHFLTSKKPRCIICTKVTQQDARSLCTWSDFSASFSGEWEGVTASFDPTGKPLPLDEHYVPSAYRDWGVELFDWQSTCSSLASPEQPDTYSLLCRRMMPTVGCEADAVAFVEEGSNTSANTLLLIAADGSYIAGPSSLPSDASKATIEVCLTVFQPPQAPPQEEEGCSLPGTKPVRLRFIHHLLRNWQSKQWQLYKTDVHHEQWDSPYRGKMELCGCGGGMKAFATTTTLNTQSIPSSSAAHIAQLSSGLDADSWSKLWSSVNKADTTTLPLATWSRISVSGAAGDIAVEVGALKRKGMDVPADASHGVCVGQAVWKEGSFVGAGVTK